eukprot:6189366-Pleurochrysis_carterae.AAC.2
MQAKGKLQTQARRREAHMAAERQFAVKQRNEEAAELNVINTSDPKYSRTVRTAYHLLPISVASHSNAEVEPGFPKSTSSMQMPVVTRHVGCLFASPPVF